MRVLVTGAGGFVGRSITAELLAAGLPVVALDRAFDAELLARWQGHAALVTGDVRAETLAALDYDAVIHAAALTASPDESGMHPIANLRANLDPALAVLEAAGPERRVLMVSSDAIFRQSAGALPDATPPTPLGLYAVAKTMLEHLADTLRTVHGYNVTVMRLGSIYGPEERTRSTRPRVSKVGQMLDAALTTGHITVTAPQHTEDWTFAPDVGRAAMALLRAGTWDYPLYNAAAGEVLTNQQAAEVIAQAVPGATLTVDGAPQPPQVRTGYLQSERLAALGFDNWTPFSDGIAAIVHLTQRGAITHD